MPAPSMSASSVKPSVTHPAVKGLEWHPLPTGYTGPDLHAAIEPRLPVGVLGVVYGYMVGPDDFSLEFGLHADTDARAVAHGLPQLVQDPNEGLYYACAGGHEALARLMMERGATEYDRGLSGACWGGHEALARLMMEKGAADYDKGLSSACLGGHEVLARLMLERDATDYNRALCNACSGGHEALVRFLKRWSVRNPRKKLSPPSSNLDELD